MIFRISENFVENIKFPVLASFDINRSANSGSALTLLDGSQQ